MRRAQLLSSFTFAMASNIAAITVGGTLLATAGISRADPVAAIAIAIGALVVAILRKSNS